MMDICNYCRELITAEITTVETSRDDTSPEDFKSLHHRNIGELTESSATCVLCLRILEAMKSSHVPGLDPFDGNPLNLQGTRHKSQTARYEELAEQGIAAVSLSRGEDPYGLSIAYIKDQSRGGDLTHRAIWNTDGEIPFSSRVPVIRTWLENCLHNHPNCESYGKEYARGSFAWEVDRAIHSEQSARIVERLSIANEVSNATDGVFRPTRLIDVGTQGSASPVRLVITSEDDELKGYHSSYIALSHCWGPQPTGIPTMKTTNIDDFKREIERGSLPKNFQDAIRVTRELGVRYLWIDSLCIQQDATEDWEHEASMMDQVYKNSLLTLSVTDSPNAHGGLHLNTLRPAVAVHVHPNEPKTRIRIPAAKEQELHHSPLQARGWVLQELVLSRRTIHFTKNQMYWQCRAHFASEDGLIHDTRFRSLGYGWIPLTQELTWSEPASAYEHWWLWVHDFSHRSFTYSGDKLAALAGITHFYAHLTGDTPVLGMWLEHVTLELSWYLESPRLAKGAEPKRAENAMLPSWTWLAHDTASVAGPFGRLASSSHQPHMIVLDVKLEWQRRPYTSNLKSMPVMAAFAASKRFAFVPWPTSHKSRLSGHKHPRRWIVEGQEPCEYSQCFFDFDVGETGFEAECLFLGWNRFPLWDEVDQILHRGFGTFLIVVRIDEESEGDPGAPGVYGRIGVGRFSGTADGATPFDPLGYKLYALV
ncbi:HET-domain-containing protein [Ophiobolus disseminans]|uniref:HET-domain-containing protein n=1 Tax=Ophiobolus disseminans TaxID=1469910 RepID=A0A6A7A598_9PLEO|nr:HET-domain-containing protein [Ophiobolus disseminans]